MSRGEVLPRGCRGAGAVPPGDVQPERGADGDVPAAVRDEPVLPGPGGGVRVPGPHELGAGEHLAAGVRVRPGLSMCLPEAGEPEHPAADDIRSVEQQRGAEGGAGGGGGGVGGRRGRERGDRVGDAGGERGRPADAEHDADADRDGAEDSGEGRGAVKGAGGQASRGELPAAAGRDPVAAGAPDPHPPVRWWNKVCLRARGI